MPSSPKAHARGELNSVIAGSARANSWPAIIWKVRSCDRPTPIPSATSPAVAILRSPLVQPAAVETHVVVKTSGQWIKGVVEKSGAGACQIPPQLRIVSQLSDQDGKNKSTRIVIRAVTSLKLGTLNGLLKHACRVRHAGKMRQLKFRQPAMFLVQGLDGKGLARQGAPSRRAS